MYSPRPLTSAMDNLHAWRLAGIATSAGHPGRRDVGDPIDRGLIMRRLLEENGFGLVLQAPTLQSRAEQEQSLKVPLREHYVPEPAFAMLIEAGPLRHFLIANGWTPPSEGGGHE